MYKINLIIIITLIFQAFGYSQWSKLEIDTELNLNSVDFWNNEYGFVAGWDKIFKTNDGGETWETSYQLPFNHKLFDLKFIDENIIIAIGEDISSGSSLIFRTTDGGNEWGITYSSNITLRSISFPSPEIGYCSGTEGNIFKSIDAGESWQEYNSGINYDLRSVYFINDLVGFAVGGNTINSVIIKTDDGGLSWDEIISPAENVLESVHFFNQNIGYVVGWNGEILKTENGGDSWEIQNSTSSTNNVEVIFTDENSGFIVGGLFNHSFVQKTGNGGATWEDISPENVGALSSINFPSSNTGYAVGNYGTIYKTISGGMTSTSSNVSLPINKINAHPNPVINNLLIESIGNSLMSSIKFHNIDGKLIRTIKCNSSTVNIDCSFLEPNTYFVEIYSNEGTTIKKIIKK